MDEQYRSYDLDPALNQLRVGTTTGVAGSAHFVTTSPPVNGVPSAYNQLESALALAVDQVSRLGELLERAGVLRAVPPTNKNNEARASLSSSLANAIQSQADRARALAEIVVSLSERLDL